MSVFRSAMIATDTGYRPPITPAQAGEVKAVRGSYAVPNTLALNDIIELVPLPPECVLVDCIVDSDDLDTNASPAITLSAGIINDTEDGLVSGTEMIVDSNVAQAGGIARMASKGAPRIASAATTRKVGVKVTTVASTKAAGTIGLTLLYRAAAYGE